MLFYILIMYCLASTSSFLLRSTYLKPSNSFRRIALPLGRTFCLSNPGQDPLQNHEANVAKVSDLSNLEIRIGQIVEIAKHPEADSLYIEKVDVGESTGPRTIVSGLVAYCSIEQMLNRKVIVLCNLKPRAFKGITSQGMLLCASNADHTQVDPIKPPESAIVGELVTFQGHAAKPIEAGNKATKIFTKIANDFFVNDQGIATFQGIPFSTSIGPVTSSLKGKIS